MIHSVGTRAMGMWMVFPTRHEPWRQMGQRMESTVTPMAPTARWYGSVHENWHEKGETEINIEFNLIF